MRIARRPITSQRFGLHLALMMLLCASFPQAAKPQERRPFEVNDLFELEGMGRYYGGPYAFSADEQKLAFTRARPKKTLANHKWEYLWGNAGGDVWVQLNPDAEPINVTNGIEDGSGWWSPQWSPDGRSLAMLSTRGGNVRLWVWNVQTREVRQVSGRGVDLARVRERPYLWVDAEHLFVPVLPDDQKPLGMRVELQTPAIASAAWPKVAEGDEVTASVLQSGVPVDLGERPQGDLLLFDISDGTKDVVIHGNTGSWHLSPSGEAVAFTSQLTPYTPEAGELLAFGSSVWEISAIHVVALDGTPISFRGEISQDVLEQSLRWSPDGNELAFFGYAGGHDRPPLLYVLNVSDRTAVSRSLAALDVTPIVREQAQLEWTATGHVILRAAKRAGDGNVDVTTRRDWWLVPRGGTPKNLTKALDTPPRLLWPEEGRMAFVGLADGELWRIEPASGEATNLTAGFDPELVRLAWPAKTNLGTDEYRIPGQSYDQVIFSVQEGMQLAPFLVDLRTGSIQPIEEPASGADLVAYGPASHTAIFYSSGRNGLRVWRSDARRGEPMRLVDANGVLREVAEGELKPITYTSLNGAELKGWLILPVGYEPGKRYPLLTWVYPGSVYGDRPPSGYLTSINSKSSLNMQIPAAHGYVVLLPSMPLAPEGLTRDPMLRLPEGVLPAVDEVIEMGIADPERLFLMGQSFGGFATYGLITQTHRFTAAVSLAGLSDLISLYGTFDARMRYTDYAHENLFQAALMESAQIGMGNPPWKDLGRYIRNSPLFFVDRVETPLMIIQGDLDYVAIQQGEEFFMALYRQGKRAQFVRYWGEGHVLESPANIKNMWRRIFAWFEEFSQRGESDWRVVSVVPSAFTAGVGVGSFWRVGSCLPRTIRGRCYD